MPELTGEEAAATFGHNRWVPVHKALRYMVLREFTTGVRRTDCLESMGLAEVVYDGLTRRKQGSAELAETLGISPEEAVEAVSLILDNWRRNRILYVIGDPIYSRYHAKDDPYIQAGLLPLREFRPEGLLLGPDQSNELCTLPDCPARVPRQSRLLLKKWASDPRTLSTWMPPQRFFGNCSPKKPKLLTKVTLRSQKEKPLAGDVWQVNSEKLVVEQCQVSPALHDLPANCHPTRPEARLHPP